MSGWFLIDLVAILPINYFMTTSDSGTTTDSQ